jgi:hypothetical protein
MADIELTRIAGDCKDNDCAAVFTTNRNSAAVQGGVIKTLDNDEAIVEIPADLLLEAARALGA